MSRSLLSLTAVTLVIEGEWDSVSLVKGQYEEWNCLLCRDPLICFTDTLFFKETKVNSILTVIDCTPTPCKAKTLDQM